MNPTVIITSDVHLSADHPELNHRFLSWLENLPKDIHHLYILGDLFDAWTDTEYDEGWLKPIIETFQYCTQQYPISLLHGNHDFLLSSAFENLTGVKIITADTLCIQHLNESIILMHGDTLATDDSGYQTLRKYLRSPTLQTIYHLFPHAFKIKLSQWIKDSSRYSKHHKSTICMQPTQLGINQAHEQHPQATQLIFGHFHRKHLEKKTYTTHQGQLEVTLLADWCSDLGTPHLKISKALNTP